MIAILILAIIGIISLTAILPYIMNMRGIILPKFRTIKMVKNIIKIYLYYFNFFIIIGLLFAVIVNNFFNIDLLVATKIITIFSIAWLAGFVIPGAPGGIGVREVVLIFFMTPIIGEAESVMVAITLRLVTLFGDLLFLF